MRCRSRALPVELLGQLGGGRYMGRWSSHRLGNCIYIYFIHTEIFASNLAVWKSFSDFTSTNQRGETSFLHVKKSFHPITNHGLSELCFRGLFRGHRGYRCRFFTFCTCVLIFVYFAANFVVSTTLTLPFCSCGDNILKLNWTILPAVCPKNPEPNWLKSARCFVF